MQLEALDIGRIHVLANREDLPVLDVDDPTVAVVVGLAVAETTGAVRLGDDLIALPNSVWIEFCGSLPSKRPRTGFRNSSMIPL